MPSRSFVEEYGARYPRNVAAYRTSSNGLVHMNRLRQPAGHYQIASDNNFVISLATNGGFSAELDVGFGRFREHCRPRCFTVLAPCEVQSTFNIDGAIEAFNISVPFSRITADVLAPLGLDSTEVFGLLHTRISYDRLVDTILDELWTEISEDGPRSYLFVDHALGVLVHRLLRLAERSPRATSESRLSSNSGGLAPRILRAVCETMAASLDAGESRSLAELAHIANLTPNHFCRAFAESTGIPPHRWLTELRIERAKALMKKPQSSLLDIALAVGYADQSTFGRAFQRITGETPSSWRRLRA